MEVVPAHRQTRLILGLSVSPVRHSHVFLHVRPGVDPSGHGVVSCGASFMALITAGHLGCSHRPADDKTESVKSLAQIGAASKPEQLDLVRASEL